ncbi:MAG: CPBP family glutamic-type intramembrane protease, partial [Clostridia bacterium]|nr:CPBP family glutamic-type intramembrane protease [Clostridia bacterium]
LAYLFSSVIFAFYHIGMTAGWVALPIFICGFVGLIAGGVIFNYLNDKHENIYSSWLVHMFINFGINTVGFILFGII